MNWITEVGSVGKLKKRLRQEMRTGTKKYTKSTLKWYRLAKDDTGVERYVWSVQDQESVRLHSLRTG